MKQQCGCPPVEEISALLDDELDDRRSSEVRRHALACAACGARLAQFEQLRGELHLLRQRTVDTDLAAIVLARLQGLRGASSAKRPRRRPAFAGLWGLGPKAMGGAAAFGAGVYLGMALLAGSGAAVRPAGMSAFDAERASAFCAGLPSCTPGRR